MKMKMKMNLLLATIITASFAASALAQYQTVGNDGIAASPKLRQTLAARPIASSIATDKVAGACCEDKIVASPKVLQTLPPQPKCCAAVVTENRVSTTADSNDGIFASPKVRQQMN